MRLGLLACLQDACTTPAARCALPPDADIQVGFEVELDCTRAGQTTRYQRQRDVEIVDAIASDLANLRALPTRLG